jgi:hypothetical protein
MAELRAPAGMGAFATFERRVLRVALSEPAARVRFLFHEGARLEGYLVLQRDLGPRRSRPVNIADWEASDDRTGLLTAALRWGRFSSIGAWAASEPESTLIS